MNTKVNILSSRPKIYLYEQEEQKSVLISNVPIDDPTFENNHVEVRVCDFGVLRDTTSSVTLNLLHNILGAAGVDVCFE